MGISNIMDKDKYDRYQQLDTVATADDLCDALLQGESDSPLIHDGQLCAMREGSPAYAAVERLLVSKYRISSADEINTIPATSTRCWNALSCLFCCCCGVHTFEVPRGKLRLAEDGSGNYLVFGPGVHRVNNVFMRRGEEVSLNDELIMCGDRTIVTIKQGHIGFCEDMGQPVLLPPGLHEWQSQTLHFVKSVDLNNSIIKLGPYTILTVDEGYCAVTQNNGQQVILPGGKTHLLSHRNWKFEKFMTKKIQTNELQRIEATSADNVMMHTDATVVWRVSNVEHAAKFSAETMRRDGSDNTPASQSDIEKLRNDVLKQATASLAAFIGEIRYSDSFHISAAGPSSATAMPVAEVGGSSTIFDGSRMASAVEAANHITKTYGVTILSINITSAIPADHELQQALARGAVASADAERAETVARGEAKAVRIRAEADAEAERIRAEGARSAAELLAESQVAVDLAKISKTGEALQGKGTNTLFFGADNGNLGGLLANPTVVNGGGIGGKR